jgi:hypothetical protein
MCFHPERLSSEPIMVIFAHATMSERDKSQLAQKKGKQGLI